MNAITRNEAAMLDAPTVSFTLNGREVSAKANELLSKVDQLGRPAADGTYDCSTLAEIEAASVEILAVMKAKTAYLDDKIAREVGPAAPAATAQPTEPATPVRPAWTGSQPPRCKPTRARS